VRHDDHGCAEVSSEAAELLQHDRLVALVELGGRFVGQDERRASCGRGSYGYALLLTTGVNTGSLAAPLGEP